MSAQFVGKATQPCKYQGHRLITQTYCRYCHICGSRLSLTLTSQIKSSSGVNKSDFSRSKKVK